MLYFLETKLENNKSLFSALTKVYGIGNNLSSLICKTLGFSFNFKVKDLTQKQILEITKLIESLGIVTNNNLRNLRSSKIKALVSIKSRRGLRSIVGLPVRGQRTHTNAKSAKRSKTRF